MAYGAKDKEAPNLHKHLKLIPSDGHGNVDFDKLLKAVTLDTGYSIAGKIELQIVKINDNSKNKR